MNSIDTLCLVFVCAMIFWTIAPKAVFGVFMGIYISSLLTYLAICDASQNRDVYSVCVTEDDTTMCHEFRHTF